MGRPNTSWPFLLDRFFERPGTIPHRVVPFFMSAFYAYVFLRDLSGQWRNITGRIRLNTPFRLWGCRFKGSAAARTLTAGPQHGCKWRWRAAPISCRQSRQAPLVSAGLPLQTCLAWRRRAGLSLGGKRTLILSPQKDPSRGWCRRVRGWWTKA